jgi:tetratricopeptide (TPR) repeat protein
VYWQSGRFEEAVQELKAAIAIRPDYAEAHSTLGTVYKQLKRLPEAAAALREAVRLQPEFAGAYSTLAAVLREQGDTARAAEAAKAAARITKEKTDLQAATFATNEGKSLLEKGDVDKAIAQFEIAIRAQSTYAPAHYHLGMAFRKKGDQKSADAAFARAAELDPRFRLEQ